MIKNYAQMERELKENMRGGKGTVELVHIFRKDELKGNARLCAKIILQPGCSIGLHDHVNEEEIYYITKGKGLVNDNGNIKEVNEGDGVITGGGAFHSIENTGTEPLELMAVILLY
jgi:mannose-6-phosphate isomerase-like protein (cupin superfamily)